MNNYCVLKAAEVTRKNFVKIYVEFYVVICILISNQTSRERSGKNMASILPVSDLRNYNEVLKNCHKGEPVYLTKNGRGRFVVMDIEDYERERAEKKLLVKLQEAEEAVKEEKEWLDLNELKALMGE